MVLQETFVLYDVIQYDTGILGTATEEYYIGSATIEPTSNGTVFTGTGYALFNKNGTTKQYYSHTLDWEAPFCFETDIVAVTGNVTTEVGNSSSIRRDIPSPSHLKITVKNGEVSIFLDNELKHTTSVTDTIFRVGVRLADANSSVTLKNTMIYPV